MRIAIAALGLCVAAGSAFAQTSYDNRNRYDDRGNTYDSRSYDSQNSDSSSYGSERSARSGDWDRDESSHHGRNMRGATFYLKSGDKEFRVDCGDEDSTRECVDAALTMFREVQKPTTGTGASSTSSSTATPSSSTSTTGSGSATGR